MVAMPFALFFASCNKNDLSILTSTTPTGPVTFNATSSSVYFFIKQSVPAGQQTLDSNLTKLNIDSVMNAKGFTGYNLDSVTVKSVTLRVTTPLNGYFDNFSYANVSVKPTGGKNILIASVNNIPKGQNSITPTVISGLGNLNSYFSNSNSYYVLFNYSLNTA